MSRELSFSVTRPIPATNEAIWAILADFGNEHRWTSTLSHCERDTNGVRVGTARVCTLARPLMGRSAVREQLTEFEPGAALAYSLEGPAGPFRRAASRWSTREAAAGTTILTVQGNFTAYNALVPFLVWPLVEPYLKGVTKHVLDEFERFVVASSAAASN